MNTKVILNMPKHTKDAVMKKAKASGLTMSSVLNMAAEAYINGRLTVGAFERGLADGRADIKAGRVYSLAQVKKMLGRVL